MVLFVGLRYFPTIISLLSNTDTIDGLNDIFSTFVNEFLISFVPFSTLSSINPETDMLSVMKAFPSEIPLPLPSFQQKA